MSVKKEQEALLVVKELAARIEKIKMENAGKYTLNEKNMERFNAVYEYFRGFAEANDGEVKYLDIKCDSVHADLSVEVPLIDLFHGGLKKFAEILQCVDVFGITPTTSDSLLIDVTVNYVWEAIK